MTKTIEYLIPLTNDTRLRHLHTHWKNKVARFVVQLEICVENKWQPIVRYDTAHRFAHKDIIHADGTKEKIPLNISDFSVIDRSASGGKEALTFSDKDLSAKGRSAYGGKANWRIYREQFLSEIPPEGGEGGKR